MRPSVVVSSAAETPLQRFHAGVVVQIIGGKAADARFVKGFAGSGKAGIIGGQRDTVFLKKAAVDHKAVGVCAYGQPVYTAVLIFKAVEVGIVDSACLVGGGEVHQAVLQGGRIVQGEAAAGYNVRQTAVFLQEFVKVQIVVAHDKLNVYVRQLRLHVGGVLFVEAVGPQIDLNGVGVLLCLHRSVLFPAQPVSRNSPSTVAASREEILCSGFFFIRLFSLVFDNLLYRLWRRKKRLQGMADPCLKALSDRIKQYPRAAENSRAS
mgnify:CR=1 FL=1